MKAVRNPRQGERYAVATSFNALVMIQWFSPFTGGYEKLLPAGLEFEILADPSATATAVAARAAPYSDWEEALVNEEDRTNKKYGGFWLCIPIELVDTNCRLLTSG